MDDVQTSDDVQDRLCSAGRDLYRQGLIAGLAGNLSARLEPGRILITRAGTHKGRLAASDLVTVDGGEDDPSDGASSELPLHRACYAADASIGAVIHTHAPALTAAGLNDLPVIERLPELRSATGVWATIELLPSGSHELALAVGSAVRRGAGDTALSAERPDQSDVGVLLLRNHGAVTVGPAVESALQRMELAELAAYAVLLAEDGDASGIMQRVNALSEALSRKATRH